jgi:hypothetical protein
MNRAGEINFLFLITSTGKQRRDDCAESNGQELGMSNGFSHGFVFGIMQTAFRRIPAIQTLPLICALCPRWFVYLRTKPGVCGGARGTSQVLAHRSILSRFLSSKALSSNNASLAGRRAMRSLQRGPVKVVTCVNIISRNGQWATGKSNLCVKYE